MFKKIIEFLQDDKGFLSSMRLALLFSVLFSSVISVVIVIKGVNASSVSLVATWLATAFGSKALQSFAENKNSDK